MNGIQNSLSVHAMNRDDSIPININESKKKDNSSQNISGVNDSINQSMMKKANQQSLSFLKEPNEDQNQKLSFHIDNDKDNQSLSDVN